MITIELAFSNLNLPRWQIMAVGPEALRRRLALMGYADAEITPTRRFMHGIRQLGTAGADGTAGGVPNERHGQRLVGSVHQSFALSLGRAAADSARRRSLSPLGATAVLPPVAGSLGALRRLQDYAGRPLAAVLYADQVHNAGPVGFDQRTAPFGQRLVQPSAHLFRCWDLDQAGTPRGRLGLLDQLTRAGLHGLCVDTFHLRNGLDWAGALDRIGAEDVPLGELHVSLGRHDIPVADAGLRTRTTAELTAALTSPEALAATECGSIVARAVQLWRSQQPAGRALRAVVEVPASALGKTDVIGMHRTLAHNVRAFLAAA
jgi:hypothetical protein